MFFSSIPQSEFLIDSSMANDPFILFEQIFTDEFFINLSEETNRYYEQTKSNSKKIEISWFKIVYNWNRKIKQLTNTESKQTQQLLKINILQLNLIYCYLK